MPRLSRLIVMFALLFLVAHHRASIPQQPVFPYP